MTAETQSVEPAVQPRPVTGPVTIAQNSVRDAADAYVARHPLASPYLQSAWLDVIHTAFGHQAIRLVAESPEGVVGVLPLVLFRSRVFGRFAVSLPFLNYGGVLADSPEVERALLDRAIAVTTAAGGTHLELRHTRQHFADLTPKRHKVAMHLALESSPEKQWDAIDRKIRNQVRKAEKSGLEAAIGGVELLPDFYGVFAHNMRDLGTPVYDVGFFREILTRFPEDSRLFTIRANGRPAAASLVHWHNGTIEVPWASAIREFNPLCANIFLYWQMVRFAAERGFRTFDFGRSTPDEGTFHFKKQWGAAPQELVWEYWTAPGHPLPQLNTKNPKFDLAIRVWQKLPIGVATAIGPHVVRNIP
jgi:FemAB-related protein (PEP-CTERM system-associated)